LPNLRILPLLIAGLLPTLSSTPAVAQQEKTGEGRSNINAVDPEPWSEQSVVALPPVPVAENLLPLQSQWFDGSYEYLLDGQSLTIGTDGVVRYTVVIRPSNGKQHVIHEGLRCETWRARVYGVGSGNRLRPVTADWQQLVNDGPYVYRRVLHDDYLCNQDDVPLDLEIALERLNGERSAGVTETGNSYYNGRR